MGLYLGYARVRASGHRGNRSASGLALVRLRSCGSTIAPHDSPFTNTKCFVLSLLSFVVFAHTFSDFGQINHRSPASYVRHLGYISIFSRALQDA